MRSGKLSRSDGTFPGTIHHLTGLNMARWTYCATRLPTEGQTVWWAIQCTAGPREILVFAGKMQDGVPMQGAYGAYEPSYYHEYIAWMPRPENEPAPPPFKAGLLPKRNGRGDWALNQV